MKNPYRGYRLALIAVVAALLFPAMGSAAVQFHETFDGASTAGGTVYFGEFTEGIDGTAWGSTAPASQRELSYPEYIEYPLPAGFFGEEGTIEFYFNRTRSAPSADGLDGVFGISDEDYHPLVQVIVDWDTGGYLGPHPSLQLGTAPIMTEMAGGPWGGAFVSLGMTPQMGRWNHLAISWGPGPKDNRIYLNGKPLSGKTVKGPEGDWQPLPGVTVASILQRAAYLRIGAETWPFGDPTDTFSPMNDMKVDQFRIHDVAFNPLDPPPVINGISHDAFEVAGYSGKLVAGDVVTVTLTGDPGAAATFDIGEKIVGVPMTENADSPGRYTGNYTVAYGDDLEDAAVTGHLVDDAGQRAEPLSAGRLVTLDAKVYLAVNPSNDLIPADREARSGLTVAAADANGKAVRDHELKMTLSTTDEYTGTVGGGSFEDNVGGTIDVDWGGVSDSFGEVTAQYISGFAAKTILISAKDMATGDVGVGWVRSYIDGTVDIVVTELKVSALSVTGSMDVSLSRDWLTADGQSRSRITAVVKNASGEPMSGHSVQFTLLGNNGTVRVVQGKTDSRGRAIADYIAGTVMGQVQVEVRDLTSGLTAIVSIELRPDAPAEITLTAEPAEVVTGGQTTVTANVTDANGNPNQNVDVLYNISVGEGAVNAPSVATDEKGNASVTFTAGNEPGLVTVRGTVISRIPTPEEMNAAKGALFLYGLAEDPGRLEVVEWLAEPGDEVAEGQALVTLEDRAGNIYILKAPRDGVLATFTAEERDRVNYGDTLGYVIEAAE